MHLPSASSLTLCVVSVFLAGHVSFHEATLAQAPACAEAWNNLGALLYVCGLLNGVPVFALSIQLAACAHLYQATPAQAPACSEA